MTKQTFSVNGMSCAACAQAIEKKLVKEKGLLKVQASYATDSVYVEFDKDTLTSTQIERIITNLGYVIGEGKAKTIKTQIISDEMVLVVTLLSSLLLFFVNMTDFLSPFKVHINLSVSTLVLFFAGKDFFLRAFQQAKNLNVNMDTLIVLGASTAYFYSLLLTFLPSYFKEVSNGYYFEASSMIISFILIGKHLEKRAKAKTSNAIQKLLQLNPTKAFVIVNGEEVETPIEEIQKGDRIQIRPAEKIPVDGRVVRGESTLDESMLTGEPLPVFKERGANLYAGTLNQEGAFVMIADKVGQDTFLSSIIKLVKEAQGSKAPIQKLADKISSIFVPTVILLASVAFLFWYFIMGESFAFSLSTFVTTLIISCPCALGLATPTAVAVGIGLGAEHGILFKDAESLQKLREIDTVVFDKTGTLTKGKPTVRKIEWAESINKTEISDLLDIVFSIEKQSEHPYGKAIVTHLRDTAKELPLDAFKVEIGKGVRAKYQGSIFLIGNKPLLEAEGIVLDEVTSSIFIAKDGKLLASIDIQDEIRTESKNLISDLRKLGKETWMLTGDSQRNATIVANEIGITEVKAEVLPQDKLATIQELQTSKKMVAMVGDGLNDAPALAQADVGISLSTGTDVAIETAEISMMNAEISKLPLAFQISEKSIHTIKQNLFFAFLYNSIAIPIAMGVLYIPFGFLISPMFGALAMSLSSISVITNSIRFRYQF